MYVVRICLKLAFFCVFVCCCILPIITSQGRVVRKAINVYPGLFCLFLLCSIRVLVKCDRILLHKARAYALKVSDFVEYQ